MSSLTVLDIQGLSGMPGTGPGVRKWLANHGVGTERNGKRFQFRLEDLPEDVRRAYLIKHIDGLDLDPGTYDDKAHAVFLEASPARRARAERKAEVARFLVALPVGTKWPERLRLVQAKFGVKGHSKPNLKTLLTRLKGVDPINFAPALLDGHEAGRPQTDIHPKAWSLFLTLIRDAAPEWPLVAAWRDVNEITPKMGWGAVPSYQTFWRRWKALPKAQQLQARLGTGEARKLLTQPIMRDKTSISPLEWVSLDGRTKDFWVDTGDGRSVRQTFIALVDVASNFILGWELVASENAADTVRLIRRVCEQYGIFDRLYPDNGRAFTGLDVSGDAPHRFRNSGKSKHEIRSPGICKIMGIKLHFALPSGPDHVGGKAKMAERVFATLSRSLDDRPEFKGAHAGHKPGASPNKDVTPIPREEALQIIKREVQRYNAQTGRRSQGANGRSYEQVFRDGLAERIVRKPTARQLYLAGLIYKPVAVDRFGRVQVHGWTYGGASTQEALLPFHGTGKRVLLGRDPDDFAAPALAFDEDGNLICEGIEPVEAGAYGSVQGIRQADRNRKAARAAVTAGTEASDYLADAELTAALAALNGLQRPAPDTKKGVVRGQFKSPIKASKQPKPMGSGGAIPLEFLNNEKSALAQSRIGGGWSA